MNFRDIRMKTTSTVTLLVMIFLIFSALEKVTGK